MHVCDVCGAPATTHAADAIETEPVKDEIGQIWATYRAGDKRFGCDAHKPETKTIYLPSRTEKEIRYMRARDRMLASQAETVCNAMRGKPPAKTTAW